MIDNMHDGAGHMKRWILSPTMGTGLLVCTTAALAVFVISLVLFHLPWGLLIGSVAGSFLWVALWNAGVVRIPIKKRALLVLFGARQEGAEVREGLHWIFPGIMSVGEVYDMQEQTFVVASVPIHTKDKIITRVDVSIQWAPKENELFFFSNVADLKAAFEAEVREAIRAYSISKVGLDSLIDLDSGETLKFMIRDYLIRRSSGAASKIKVNPLGEIKYISDIRTMPWGLDVRSVAVTGFSLDESITTAAPRTEVAKADRQAAEILRAGVLEAVEALRAQGLDPVIALEEGNLLLFPERASPPVRRWAITGLDGTVRTLVESIFHAVGKRPPPVDISDSSQQKNIEKNGDE